MPETKIQQKNSTQEAPNLDLNELKLPTYHRHSTIDCHSSPKSRLTESDFANLKPFFKNTTLPETLLQLTSTDNDATKNTSPEIFLPKTANQIIQDIKSTGINLEGLAAKRFAEYEQTLRKEENSLSPFKLSSRIDIPKLLSEIDNPTPSDNSSQFALGRFISTITNQSPEIANNAFVEKMLHHATSPSTQLAALKLAEQNKSQITDEILKPHLESGNIEISTSAARVRALQTSKIKSFSDLQNDLEIKSTPRNINFLISGNIDHSGKLDLPDYKKEDESRNLELRKKQIFALETLLARPDIEVPGGVDKLLLKLIGENQKTEDEILISRHRPSRSQGKLIEEITLRFAEAGRLENPLETLRQAINKNGESNSEILQYISKHPELASRYSTKDIMHDQTNTIQNGRRYKSDFNLNARFGDILSKHLHDTNPNLNLDEIGPTLFNALSHFQENYPRTWESATPQQIDKFAIELSKLIGDQRQSLIDQNPTIMGEGIRFLAVAHADPGFSLEPINKLIEKYKMEKVEVLKASKDPFIQADQKENVLEQISKLAADPTKNATIYFDGHGGPNHFYFSDGTIDRAFSMDLQKPNAISYAELAKTLVEAQSNNSKIDLSHMRFLNEACLQHDFIKQFHAEVFKLANEQGIEVKGMPLMVSVSQAGEPGYGIPFSIYREKLNDVMSNHTGPLKLEHLLITDRELKRKVDEALLMPAEEKFLMRSSQDPALFSPLVIPQQKVEELLQQSFPNLQESIKTDTLKKPDPWTNEVSQIKSPQKAKDVSLV